MHRRRISSGKARRYLVGQLRPHHRQRDQNSRPCVVISPPELNSQLRTVMVAPITHAGTKGLIVLDQLRPVDKSRSPKRLGATSTKTMSLVLVLVLVFATLQDFFAD